MEENELLIYVSFALATFIIMIGAILWILISFSRARVNYVKERTELEAQYNLEMSKTKSEIQNETLNRVGQELHDNIGQLLAVAKIYSNLYIETKDDSKSQELDRTLEKVIDETRQLAHSLDIGRPQDFNLTQALENEVIRINNTDKLKLELSIESSSIELNLDQEIIVFRIIQEFISNTLKHTSAQHLYIALSHCDDIVQVMLKDDGQGFKRDAVQEGRGLTNIENRIKLLNGEMTLNTSTGQGTELICRIPKKERYDL